MNRIYVWYSSLSIFVFVLVIISSAAHADNTSQFNDQIKAYQADRLKVESQLSIKENDWKRSTYYAPYLGHYEKEQIVKKDMDNRGIHFNDQMKFFQNDRAKVEAKLSITEIYPHASSYYDDKVDHYEQVQLMQDVIAQGI